MRNNEQGMTTFDQRNILEKRISEHRGDVKTLLEADLPGQTGIPLGQLVSLLVISGHVELAEAMVDQGAVPEKITGRTSEIAGIGFSPAPEKERAIPLAHALLRLYGMRAHHDDYIVTKVAVNAMKKILARPDVWPAGINEISEGYTALSMMPYAGGKKSTERRNQLIHALLEAGADINLHSSTHNIMQTVMWCRNGQHEKKLLNNGIGMSSSDLDELLSSDAAWFMDQLIELGFDAKIAPHIAISSAIGSDAQHVNETRKGMFLGVRTQSLVNRGFSMSSPINCPREVNPYFVAIETGQSSVVRALLNAGEDPCWIDPETGDTLFVASQNNKKFTANALLLLSNEHVRKIANHANNKGDTPLHQAVSVLSIPLIKKLIECGADINAVNKKGNLPLQMVKRTNPKVKKQLEEIVELFDAHGAEKASSNVKGLLIQACKSGAGDLVAKLLQQGADANERDANKRTPLIIAALNVKDNFYETKVRDKAIEAHRDLVDHLIHAGADINAQDKDGITALHAAFYNRGHTMVMALLDAGANPHLAPKKQKSVFSMITATPDNTQDKIMREILARYEANTLSATTTSVVQQVKRRSL